MAFTPAYKVGNAKMQFSLCTNDLNMDSDDEGEALESLSALLVRDLSVPIPIRAVNKRRSNIIQLRAAAIWSAIKKKMSGSGVSVRAAGPKAVRFTI